MDKLNNEMNVKDEYIIEIFDKRDIEKINLLMENVEKSSFRSKIISKIESLMSIGKSLHIFSLVHLFINFE